MSKAARNGVTCWLIDTRDIWHGDRIENVASHILKFLPANEQKTITSKVFIADAKLSLASALLKRLYVSQVLDIPWSDVRFTRRGDPKHGKPIAVIPPECCVHMDFNVSHQAGLVALIGYASTPFPSVAAQSLTNASRNGNNGEEAVSVGVDIVCINERNDYRSIDTDGFDAWVDVYDQVFSEPERFDMKYTIDKLTLSDGRVLHSEQLGRLDRCIHRHKTLTASIPATTTSSNSSTDVENKGQQVEFSSNLLIAAKLRRFYAFFAYKEAYVKLEGEALLAPWLRDLEFGNVKSSDAVNVDANTSILAHSEKWGQNLTHSDISIAGRPVRDVSMAIQAFEENHMIATAVRSTEKLHVPDFTILDVEKDFLSIARA